MSEIFIIGDSHAGVYAKAATALGMMDIKGGPLGAASNFYHDFFTLSGGTLGFVGFPLDKNFESWKEHSGVTDLRQCRASLVVSLGLASAPFCGHPMWRFFDQKAGTRHHLSSGLLEQIILDLQNHALRFLKTCHSMKLLCAVAAAPPPQRRHRALEILGAERLLSLHHAFQKPVRDWLDSVGIAIAEPQDTTDSEGFLKEEFWGNDPAHGNQAYAATVLREINRIKADFDGDIFDNSAPEVSHEPEAETTAEVQKIDATLIAAKLLPLKVGVLGSCRVYTPLGIANDAGKLKRRVNGVFGYIHSTPEFLQAIRILRGQLPVPESLAALMCVKRPHLLAPSLDLFQKNFGGVDILVMEVSSLRAVELRGYALQINLARIFLTEAGLSTESCSLPTVFEEREQRIAKLGEGTLTAAQTLAVDLLRNGSFHEMDAAELDQDLEKIRVEVNQPILFVGPFVEDYDGNPIPQRELLRSRLAAAASKYPRTGFLDPTPVLKAHGYQDALKDLGHYRKTFEPKAAEMLTEALQKFRQSLL